MLTWKFSRSVWHCGHLLQKSTTVNMNDDILVWIALGIGEEITVCPVKHEGREIVNVVLPMSVDDLFTLLFANSTFYLDYLTNTLKSTGMRNAFAVCFVCLFGSLSVRMGSVLNWNERDWIELNRIEIILVGNSIGCIGFWGIQIDPGGFELKGVWWIRFWWIHLKSAWPKRDERECELDQNWPCVELVTDLQMGQWQEGGEKTRKFSYTIPLNNNIGVKSCRTTEHQVSFTFLITRIIIFIIFEWILEHAVRYLMVLFFCRFCLLSL